MFTGTKGLFLLVLVGCLLLTGCANAMRPVTGSMYSDVKGPLLATGNNQDLNSGTSEAVSYLGVVALGDASIKTAMQNGKITKVHHVDYHTYCIAGVYAKLTVTVYGE